jgi:hypothetical protein
LPYGIKLNEVYVKDFHSLPFKERRVRWAGHVAVLGMKQKIYIFFKEGGNIKGKYLKDFRCLWSRLEGCELCPQGNAGGGGVSSSPFPTPSRYCMFLIKPTPHFKTHTHKLNSLLTPNSIGHQTYLPKITAASKVSCSTCNLPYFVVFVVDGDSVYSYYLNPNGGRERCAQGVSGET